ncbi:Short-chain dehydrogenase [Enhydrobacter aerosaccus]|uniref:Short-chain dehydrogenase n=1 Tax=Enhydrobacter aerosaccus TaxID=225324 RepID=A0A1T4MU12_9HYPH|nr:SDR family NAD(P)-dependent oxidoreductase [Enhydrobacter aerosaccus]SJZ70324.1 Short-chain dehydrogenase [Enhydrobacter aerosaccus]
MVQSRHPQPRKSILITGASSGIGAALAQALSTSGRTLALLGRDEARLDAIADACRAKGAQCKVGVIDICDHAAMADFISLFEREHGIDLLVLNAGIMTGRPADNALETGAAAQRLLEINLVAAIDTLHLALPGMLQRRRGEIVFMASLSGLAPLQDAPAYSASKAALLSYGVALRDAVAESGINVMVVCPGYVATPMVAKHRGARPGEVSAADAARRILKGLDANKGLIGFPIWLYWLSRVALLAPEFLRRKTMSLFRFHLDA